jgi:PhnB protein
MPVSPIPPGYRSITPYLAIDGAIRALAFYVEAFGARERMRLEMPGGKIGHAEIEIGDSVVMLADPWPDGQFVAPQSDGVPVTIHLYVEDADAAFDRAVAAGAVPMQPMSTKFYGDRTGTLRDPFGHRWHLATHVEDVPEEEIERRLQAMAGG